MATRHLGPQEQRLIYEQLPWCLGDPSSPSLMPVMRLMQRLHGWFALSNPGLEAGDLDLDPSWPLHVLAPSMLLGALVGSEGA